MQKLQLRTGPDPQKLHDRAAESAKEMRQIVLALSSGALAVFFLALTTDKAVEPPLRLSEKVILLFSLACMSLAVFASLWSAFVDAQWSYWWGRALEERAEDAQDKKAILVRQDRFHRYKRRGERVLLWAFALGVLLAAVYLASRIYSLSTKIT